MTEVKKALDDLNDCIVLADCIGQGFDLAGGESVPAWVYVYRQQIAAITAAAEALETLIRKDFHVCAD